MNPALPNDPNAEREARLTALLLGELGDAEAAALRAELANDPDLARLHDELKRTLPLVRETIATPADATAAPPAPLKLSDERRAKLLAQFKTVPFKQSAPAGKTDWNWLVPLGAAAVLALIVGSISMPHLAKERRITQRLPINLMNVVGVNGTDPTTKSEAQRASFLAFYNDNYATAESDTKPADASDVWGGVQVTLPPAPPPATPLPKIDIVLPRGGKPSDQLSLIDGFAGGTDRFASRLSEEWDSRTDLYNSLKGGTVRSSGSALQPARPKAGQLAADGRDWYFNTAPTPFFSSGTDRQSDAAPRGEPAVVTAGVSTFLKSGGGTVHLYGANTLSGGTVEQWGRPAVGSDGVKSENQIAFENPSQKGLVDDGSIRASIRPESGGAVVAGEGIRVLNSPVDLHAVPITPSTLSADGGVARSFGYAVNGQIAGQVKPATAESLVQVDSRGSAPEGMASTKTSLGVPLPTLSRAQGFRFQQAQSGASVAESAPSTPGAIATDANARRNVAATGTLAIARPDAVSSTPAVADPSSSSKADRSEDFVAARPTGTTQESRFMGEGKLPANPLPGDKLGEPSAKLGDKRNPARFAEGGALAALNFSGDAKLADAQKKYTEFGAGAVTAGTAFQTFAGQTSAVELREKGQSGQDMEKLGSLSVVPAKPSVNALESGLSRLLTEAEIKDVAGEKSMVRSVEVNLLDRESLARSGGPDSSGASVVGKEVKTTPLSTRGLTEDRETVRLMLESSERSLGELKQLESNQRGRELTKAVPDHDLVTLGGQLKVAEEKLAQLQRTPNLADADGEAGGNLALVRKDVENLRKRFDERAQGVIGELENKRQFLKEQLVALDDPTGKGKKLEDEAARKAKPSPAPIPQPEVFARDNAFSTFSLNVSDVSFKLAAASLEQGQMPEAASVRSEEFINAFDYRDPEAAPGVPVAFAWERARYPFAHNRDLLRFSLKTAAIGRQAGRALNLVLVVDNSGSMERADRVRILREALRVLAGELRAEDKFSVITFARTPRLVADGVTGSRAGEIAQQVAGVTPEGGTNIEEALNLGYATALRHYLAGGMNRIVLVTDGAANLGIVDPDALKARVEAHRKQGVALDCFGIGWEGFNDDLLEVLSRNGDGRYDFINTPEDAATDFAGQLAGALKVAASDVKVQVEFNPRRVTSHRQIGYAKHQLTKEQFRDNTVDAAEIAAQEAGNALYTVETNPNGSGPIATVRVRFKIPGTADYREHEWAVPYTVNTLALEHASPAMRLAATASAFSEWLASSPFAGEVTPDRLLGYLSGVPEVYGADARPKKLEWMLRQAKSVSGK